MANIFVEEFQGSFLFLFGTEASFRHVGGTEYFGCIYLFTFVVEVRWDFC